MELTRQQKILGAVLGLGLVAVVVDRALLGGGGSEPAQAQAGASATDRTESPDNPSLSPPPATAVEAPRPGTPANPPLLHRMRALPEAQVYEQARSLDAFKPPADWLPPPPVIDAAAPPLDTRVEAFTRHHRLTSVMTSAGAECAVIGGRTYKLGSSLDGFVLVAIDLRSVTFRADDGVEVTLSLPEPGSRSP